MNPFKKFLILLLMGGFGVLPKLQAQSVLHFQEAVVHRDVQSIILNLYLLNKRR